MFAHEENAILECDISILHTYNISNLRSVESILCFSFNIRVKLSIYKLKGKTFILLILFFYYYNNNKIVSNDLLILIFKFYNR